SSAAREMLVWRAAASKASSSGIGGRKEEKGRAMSCTDGMKCADHSAMAVESRRRSVPVRIKCCSKVDMQDSALAGYSKPPYGDKRNAHSLQDRCRSHAARARLRRQRQCP